MGRSSAQSAASGEHVFRNRDLKLVDGELFRFVNENGEPKWICITAWASPFERTLLALLREVVER